MWYKLLYKILQWEELDIITKDVNFEFFTIYLWNIYVNIFILIQFIIFHERI